jgi:RimJ/RimL family protein N-acetyltransferase
MEPSPVFFHSERLWFRPPCEADAERLARWINHPPVRRFLASRVFPIGLEAEREWIRGVSPSVMLGTPAATKIALLFGPQGEEQPIGSTGLFGIDWVVRRAEWGILIGETDRWNQGFGREVARRMLRYAFEELNLNRVELRVNTGNAGGVKAYEQAGFVREGLMRQTGFIDGEYQDSFVMSVLRSEWRPRS